MSVAASRPRAASGGSRSRARPARRRRSTTSYSIDSRAGSSVVALGHPARSVRLDVPAFYAGDVLGDRRRRWQAAGRSPRVAPRGSACDEDARCTAIDHDGSDRRCSTSTSRPGVDLALDEAPHDRFAECAARPRAAAAPAPDASPRPVQACAAERPARAALLSPRGRRAGRRRGRGRCPRAGRDGRDPRGAARPPGGLRRLRPEAHRRGSSSSRTARRGRA